MAPRVLVDATAVSADRGGLGRYVDGLVSALDASGADLAVAAQRPDADRYARLAPSAQILTGPTALNHRTARLAWEQTGLPTMAQQIGADVVHCPSYTMPLRSPCPVVVTIHDATRFSEPELYSPVRGPVVRSAIRTAVHRATRCIVPSKATRDEIVRLVGADPTRIDVAYHGVDHAIFHPPTEQERERVAVRLGLRGGQPYVAFLGTLEPRRNVPNLVRGWIRAVAGGVPGFETAPALVLAGGSGWDEQVDAAVAEVPESLRVIRPGYLRFGDLPGFLGGASVVAYPSHGEGFGLPVLEAMACGAPVLTTARLSLPEVGGDAVAYTEPDAGSIAAGLRALLADPERRSALGAAAAERSLEFTWAHSARAHLAAYERAMTDGVDGVEGAGGQPGPR